MWAELFHADRERRTDRHGEVSRLFRNFANAPKNVLLLALYKILFTYKLHETKWNNLMEENS
jgi:hypothetical protein